LWKVELQKLVDEIAIPIKVCHYPPGTSKWNKIEHRLFCHITQNWRAKPRVSRAAIVELIAATTTKTGLKVECALDERTYENEIPTRWSYSLRSIVGARRSMTAKTTIEGANAVIIPRRYNCIPAMPLPVYLDHALCLAVVILPGLPLKKINRSTSCND